MLIFERNPTVRGVDRQRLREIAHELRNEGAKCFLERAITTMVHDPDDAEEPFKGVPAGQAKYRVRLRPDGVVARATTLDSGFGDKSLDACVLRAVERKRFPRNDSGTLHSVDIVYWASLGFHKQARSPIFAERLRREAAALAPRARRCFRGRRLEQGAYMVDALNLFVPQGLTATNRVRHADLPGPVLKCLASAFKDMRIEPEPGSFVRPGFFNIEFKVGETGEITVADEEWLRWMELEDRAEREARIEALGGSLEASEDGPTPESNREQTQEAGPEDPAPIDPEPPAETSNEPPPGSLLNPRLPAKNTEKLDPREPDVPG